ncbi:autotransporter domain-containing protein [Rickettsiales bacterium]|nr:autotransporter domain-containing protein [Rickettsiales bacterium]
MKKLLFIFLICISNNIYATIFTINGSDQSLSTYNSASDDAIEFASDNILTIDVSNSSNINSITTNTDNQGIIEFNTDATNLTIIDNIGSSDLRLGDLNFTVNDAQTSDINSTNSGTIYLQNIDIGQDLGSSITIKTISGNAIIDAENLNISQNLTLNNQANIGTIAFNQDANAIFDNIAISGDVSENSATGRLITTSDGSINLNGSNVQTIGVALGDYDVSGPTTTYVNSLNINNSNASGISFNSGNISYIQDMVFNHNEENSQITLSSTIFHLNGNITNSNSNIDDFYILSSGTGEIILTGQTQDIDANFGTSGSRFNDLQIQSSEVDLSGDLYLTTLNIVQNADRLNAITDIDNNGILDISSLDMDNSLTANGSGTLNIANIDIVDSKILTLNLDSNISGNIVDSGAVGAKIISNNNNITFSGTSAQNIAVLMGDSSNRIDQISSSNSNIVTLDQNIFVKDVAFSNTSSGGELLIGSGDELDVTGNITALSAANSAITGSSGTLDLSGSGVQNITASLGTSSTRLNNLNINNNNVVINNNVTSYVNNFNLTSGSIGLTSGSIIDVDNALDLSGKTVNYVITSTSDAAKITSTSSNEITTSSSNINIDYSNISGTGLSSYLGTSDDIIDNNSGAATINTSNINLSDNSYLANASIATRASDEILTLTTNLDSNIVNVSNLGQQYYNIVTYLINDLEISNLLSISSQEEFNIFQNSLIPKNNSNIKNNINLANNIDFIIDSKVSQPGNNSIWGDLLLSSLHHKTDSTQNGFDAVNSGFIFGYDSQINKNNLLGASIFYANSNIEGGNELQDDQNNAIGFSLYHKHYSQDQKGLFSFNKLISFYNFYSLERKIDLGNENRIAKSKTNGITANLETGIGYKYNKGKISYIPKLSYQYFRDQIDSYDESGAGDLSLNIADNNYNSHKLQLGLDLESSSDIEHKELIFRPKFGVYITKKIAGSNNQIMEMNFVNNSTKYQITLPDINDDYLTTNLEIDILQKDKMPIINFKYLGNFSSDIMSHLASINFKYNF